MVVVRWDENLPSGSSGINLGDDDLRSRATNLRGALADEHNWPTGPSSADRGTHSPNASRVSFGSVANAPATVASLLSGIVYQQTGGTPYLTLAYVEDGGSHVSYPIGGLRVLLQSATGVELAPSAQYFAVDDIVIAAGSAFSWTNTFTGVPTVTATVVNALARMATIVSVDSASCTIDSFTDAGIDSSGDSIHVLALGAIAT